MVVLSMSISRIKKDAAYHRILDEMVRRKLAHRSAVLQKIADECGIDTNNASWKSEAKRVAANRYMDSQTVRGRGRPRRPAIDYRLVRLVNDLDKQLEVSGQSITKMRFAEYVRDALLNEGDKPPTLASIEKKIRKYRREGLLEIK